MEKGVVAVEVGNNDGMIDDSILGANNRFVMGSSLGTSEGEVDVVPLGSDDD